MTRKEKSFIEDMILRYKAWAESERRLVLTCDPSDRDEHDLLARLNDTSASVLSNLLIDLSDL